MSTGSMDLARAALKAWQEGDVSALEPLLAPEVELLWWKPGEWDCHGRDEVLGLLRERAKQGARPADVELIEVDEDTLVVSRDRTPHDGPAAGTQPATVVRFRGGRVVSMRQFRRRQEALEAVR